MLFHISEEPGIERFEPRPAADGSRVSVVPARVDVVDDAMAELLRRGVELRVVANLWPLRDAVVDSSLEFSIIRMRNAQPR
jgi:hypothetical protein